MPGDPSPAPVKTLVLLRHAKSSWGDPRQDDHERPLNARGRMAAPVIARWLAAHGYLPDTVLCSSAARARETVEVMRAAVQRLPEPVVDRGLYLASPGAMRDRLARLPPDCAAVMLVGHQPGLGALARELADGSEGPRCSRAYEKFPTAAAAVFRLDREDWSRLAFGTARFTDFATPRELEGG